jgi:hypothetical protein
MRGAIPALYHVFMAWYLVKNRDKFTFYLKETDDIGDADFVE